MKEENVGTKFNQSLHLKAQSNTIQLTHALVKKFETGMSENDAHEILKIELKKLEVEKLWHPSKIRFGKNTLKSFRDISDEKIKFDPQDLFFLDLGPVFFDHEGDYGETFILGVNPEYLKLIESSKKLFHLTCEKWKKEQLTGIKLYEYAAQTAQDWGYELNLRMDGHRVSDFPHALIHKGDLGEFHHSPTSGLWILEIHLLDHKIDRGAFFEDLLI